MVWTVCAARGLALPRRARRGNGDTLILRGPVAAIAPDGLGHKV